MRPRLRLAVAGVDWVGYPKLREHLGSIVTLMKLRKDWPDFQMKLDQIRPRYGDTIALQFPIDDDGTGL